MTLTSLNFSNNAIGEVRVNALAKGLKENLTLTKVYLSGDEVVASLN